MSLTTNSLNFSVYMGGPFGGAGQTGGSRPYQAFDGPLYFGQDSLGNRYFQGSLDEVAIFTRTLSMDEITQLSQSFVAPPTLSIQQSGNSYILNWYGAGHVLYSDDIDAPFSSWRQVWGGLSPWTDTPDPSKPQRFYRLLRMR